VNSIKATKFRIWATTVLKEYMTKGFVLDDDLLKQGKTAFGSRMLVRCDANGKLFLYDIVQIKKETSTPLE
nr:virulence RhuM family protein [Lachnospiraceae bacterium]